jgi:hypothetical protein
MVAGLVEDILATYRRHNWQLRRALLRPETLAALIDDAKSTLEDAELIESDFDALWFARPSHAGREAWELRLLSETPYALFEAFAADESEEQREEKRREMERRMRAQASGKL